MDPPASWIPGGPRQPSTPCYLKRTCLGQVLFFSSLVMTLRSSLSDQPVVRNGPVILVKVAPIWQHPANCAVTAGFEMKRADTPFARIRQVGSYPVVGCSRSTNHTLTSVSGAIPRARACSSILVLDTGCPPARHPPLGYGKRPVLGRTVSLPPQRGRCQIPGALPRPTFVSSPPCRAAARASFASRAAGRSWPCPPR
jgi:hypothetical protein